MMKENQTNNLDASPPDEILLQMLFWMLIQRCIGVAAKLGIADLLAEGPKTITELAAKTETREPSLYRVLRTLGSVGIFAETPNQNFELTPLAELLRCDVPSSMRDVVIFMDEQWLWDAGGQLMHNVKTGGIPLYKVQGISAVEYFARNAEAKKIFYRAMTNMSRKVIPAIAEAYNFSDIHKLVDIAGGHGLLLARILKMYPQIEGILFDLPYVIEAAKELVNKEGVMNRVELAPGNFFKSVPAGADAYMLKNIIHDWDDELSIIILRNIRAAMKEKGKVLIIEMLVPEGNQPSPSIGLDIMMLAIGTGKERTAGEYGKLLEASGFKLTRIIPTKLEYSVVEGEPV